MSPITSDYYADNFKDLVYPISREDAGQHVWRSTQMEVGCSGSLRVDLATSISRSKHALGPSNLGFLDLSALRMSVH